MDRNMLDETPDNADAAFIEFLSAISECSAVESVNTIANKISSCIKSTVDGDTMQEHYKYLVENKYTKLMVGSVVALTKKRLDNACEMSVEDIVCL